MNDDKRLDPYTYHILNSIDYRIKNSFTTEQLSAVRDAIRANQPFRKHAVNVRGRINLFFMSFYFVFLMGRDRRLSTEAVEEERRGRISLFGNAVFMFIVLSALVMIIIVGLYSLKIIAGVDLVPGRHMGEFIGL